MSPDGKNWTLNLREGVPFHFGFGEFTAKDVVHTLGAGRRCKHLEQCVARDR